MSIVHTGERDDRDSQWAADGWAEGDWADEGWADEGWAGDRSGIDPFAVAGLRLVLSDDLAEADAAALEEALVDVMGAMGPAEAFNFGTALAQVARGASRTLADPQVASLARTVLPIAGGALGTVVGGPVGTALGSQLGTVAANALPAAAAPRGAVRPPTTAVPGRPATSPSPTPPHAGGSTAAAQSLALAGNPLLQQALVAAAFGQHGQQQVAGIPVAQLLGLLGGLVNQAAAEADELAYGLGSGDAEATDPRWGGDPLELYTALMDAETLDLAAAAEELEADDLEADNLEADVLDAWAGEAR